MLKGAPVLVITAAITIAGCSSNAASHASQQLVGAWRASVHFDAGPFASLQDLEFMYVFNAGGTMTESSNYDGAPPVAPAYGSWTQVGRGEFVVAYEFFITKPPARLDELATGGGWTPDGRGAFDEHIRVSLDGSAFDSTIRYSPMKPDGSPAGEPVTGRAQAVRIGVQRH